MALHFDVFDAPIKVTMHNWDPYIYIYIYVCVCVSVCMCERVSVWLSVCVLWDFALFHGEQTKIDAGHTLPSTYVYKDRV